MLSLERSEKHLAGLLLLGVAAFLTGMFLLAATPPYDRDSLIHHLAIPKLWITEGGFYEMPWAPFSYYPMNIELIYLACLLLGSDLMPNFVHLCFAIATGLIIYSYVSRRLGKNYALLGLLIWLSTPAVIRFGTSAYIDLGLSFLISLVIYFLLTLMEGEVRVKWVLLLLSLFTGLALGSKYTALITLPFFVGWLLLVMNRRFGQVMAAKYTATYLVLALLIASPWYLKNFALTGNPVYPLSVHLGGPQSPQRELRTSEDSISDRLEKVSPRLEVGGYTLLQRRFVYSENPLEILTVPLRMFWQGKDDSAQFFDGVLNPVYLLFLPFFWLDRRFRKSLLVLLLFAWFFIFIVFFLKGMRIRYVLPALPPLLIVNLFGLRALISRISNPVRSLVIACIVVSVGVNFHYLWVRMNFVKPWLYLASYESRDEFLGRLVGSYRPIQWVNANLPKDARVLFIMVGHRGYYCERAYQLVPGFGRKILDIMIEREDAASLRRIFSELNVTHILSNHYLVFKYLGFTHTSEEIDKLKRNMGQISNQVYREGPYSVLQID